MGGGLGTSTRVYVCLMMPKQLNVCTTFSGSFLSRDNRFRRCGEPRIVDVPQAASHKEESLLVPMKHRENVWGECGKGSMCS